MFVHVSKPNRRNNSQFFLANCPKSSQLAKDSFRMRPIVQQTQPASVCVCEREAEANMPRNKANKEEATDSGRGRGSSSSNSNRQRQQS